jgi:hypothetical protein
MGLTLSDGLEEISLGVKMRMMSRMGKVFQLVHAPRPLLKTVFKFSHFEIVIL